MLNFSDIKNRLSASPLFKDSFWSLLGSVVGKGLAVVAGVLVARFLGKEIYGEYGILKNTLIYLEIFSTFGLGYTATKFVAQYRKNNQVQSKEISNASMIVTLVTSSFIACILLLFSKQVAVLIDAPQLDKGIKLLAIAVIPNAVNVAQIGILSGYSAFKTIAKNTVFSGICTFVLTILLTLKFGLTGAVLALVLSYAIQCLLNHISIRKIHAGLPVVRVKKQTYKDIVSYSLPIALQEGLYSVTNWLVSFIIIKLSGYGELGMYTAAIQVTAIMGFIPSILSNVTLSHFAHRIDDTDGFAKTRRVMMLTNFVSTTGIFFLILLFSDIITSFFGSSFSGLSKVFLVSCITSIIASLSSVYVQECLSSNHNWFLFTARVVRDFTTLTCGFVLLSHNTGGAFYMCVSTLIANIIYFCMLHFFLRKYSLVSK